MKDTEQYLDDRGYLRDIRSWSPQMAGALAARVGIGELTEQHMAVLRLLRDQRKSRAALPPPTLICHELGLASDCIDRLFGGPANAWKVAGLPDPGEEARVYLENQTPGA